MVVISDCTDCKNLGNYEEGKGMPCQAFPEGIPSEWFLKWNPKEVKECSNGIGFEPYKGEEEANKGKK